MRSPLLRRRQRGIWPIALTLLMLTACASVAQQSTATPGPLAVAFTVAAQHAHVPQPLLEAVAYVETRWHSHLPSGSAGIMGLFDTKRHDGTITQAATLTGASTTTLAQDPATNIQGAAAVLAADAAALGTSVTPDAVGGWYGAVAAYAGERWYEPAQWFANEVFATLSHGVHATADDGEVLTIAAQTATPDANQLAALHLPHVPAQPGDYPNASTVYAPTAGSFDVANRPNDGLDIRYIVIHDTEENYANTTRLFTDPDDGASAHYVVNGGSSSYPAVTQFVPESDVSYQAGNYPYNQHSIGIEHIGFATAPDGYYTQALYDTSAQLVAYLCWKYHIPIDRAHILGHGSVPGSSQHSHNGQHWDPGSFWDWPYYLARIRQDYAQWSNGAAPVVPTIDSGYQATRATIRTINVNGNHASASDIASWSQTSYANYTPVYADDQGKPGSQLILGASDPNTAIDQTTYSVPDFICDNTPAQPVGDHTQQANTGFDLRAKAEFGEAFALLGTYTDGQGAAWDKVDFNGVVGWVKAAATQDGWGARVTFASGTRLTGSPGGPAICADGGNDSSRAGQTYIAQDVQTDANGATWYSIFYNHRIVWVPASEVTLG